MENELTIRQPVYDLGTLWSPDVWSTKLHMYAEATWHNATGAGAGTWEGQGGSTTPPPYLRMITCRGRMYLAADRELQRVHQACDYLLSIQRADGRWESTSTASPTATIDDAFDTAECGEMLYHAFRRFGIVEYRAAATAAVAWLLTGTVSAQYADAEYYAEHPTDSPFLQLYAFQNANFMGSMLRCLSEAYRDSGEVTVQAAMRQGVQGLLAWQQPDGTWVHYGDYPGGVLQGSQVKSMVYHDLATVGLLAAWEHGDFWTSEEREALHKGIWRALNYTISQQQSSGLMLLRLDQPYTVCAGGWSVAWAMRAMFQSPVNQYRGKTVLWNLGKGMENVMWQGQSKAMLDTRLLLYRMLTEVVRWTTWYERA